MTEHGSPFLVSRAAAEHLSVSRATINRYIANGDVPSVEIAGRRRIPRKAFNAWCDEIGIARLDVHESDAA